MLLTVEARKKGDMTNTVRINTDMTANMEWCMGFMELHGEGGPNTNVGTWKYVQGSCLKCGPREKQGQVLNQTVHNTRPSVGTGSSPD